MGIFNGSERLDNVRLQPAAARDNVVAKLQKWNVSDELVAAEQVRLGHRALEGPISCIEATHYPFDMPKKQSICHKNKTKFY